MPRTQSEIGDWSFTVAGPQLLSPVTGGWRHVDVPVITVNSDNTASALNWAFDGQFAGRGHRR